jgi:Tetratricopeptide repeat
LADVVSRQDGYAGAQPIFEDSISILDELQDRWGMAFAIDSSALAAAREGETDVARDLHGRALAISRELGDDRGVARTLMHLADLALAQGDASSAKELHRECLRIRHALKDMPGIASEMERFAWVLAADAAEDAARLLGVADALRDSIHVPMPRTARADYERSVRALAARLGDEAFESIRIEGRAITVEQAIAALLA